MDGERRDVEKGNNERKGDKDIQKMYRHEVNREEGKLRRGE